MCVSAGAKAMLGRLILVLMVSTLGSGASPSSSLLLLNSAAQHAAAAVPTAMVPTIATSRSRSSRSTTTTITNPTSLAGSRPEGQWGGLRIPVAGRSSFHTGVRRRRSRRTRWDRRMMAGAASMRCFCAVPPPNVSPLAWDLGVSTVVGASSVLWVKLWTTLARKDRMKPQVSRKVVHTTAAPLFMVLWPFFTDRPCARLFASAVPMVQAVRLAAAGRSGDPGNNDTSKSELVKAISRSGRASETLGGPLKYTLSIVLITMLEWRTSVVGVIAMLQMAVGDGMADLVGRKVGKHKWRSGGEKSVEGSAAFASGSFLASLAMIKWFNRCGMLAMTPAEAAARAAFVSVACAAVELLPARVVGDDNFSVPVTGLVLGRLLFK